MTWRSRFAPLLALLALAFVAVPLFAQTSPVDNPPPHTSGTITAAGVTPWLVLNTQSSCTVTLGPGNGSAMTIVPQVTGDWPVGSTNTPVTASSINSGSISTNGSYTGAISANGTTGIRLNVTGFTVGTVPEQYQIVCTNAAPSVSAGSVTVSPVPLPVIVPTTAAGLAVPVAVFCPSSAPAPTNGGYSCTINSAGVLNVSSPVPLPTITPGLLPGVILACPSSAPAVQNSAYICTINSAGQMIVTTPAPAPTGTSGDVAVEPTPFLGISTPNPTSSPTTVKAAPGTLGGARFINNSAGTLYIGFYDALTANVTLGTTVAKNVLMCPTLSYCFLPLPDGGVTYTTGISYLCGSALTGGVPTTGCGSNTTSLLMIDYRYRADVCRQPSDHLSIRGPTLALWDYRKRCSGASP